MKIKLLIILFFSLLNLKSISQNLRRDFIDSKIKFSDLHRGNAISLGYSYYNFNSFTIGITRFATFQEASKDSCFRCAGKGFVGLNLGLEILKFDKSILFNPRVSLEFYYWLLGLRTNMMYSNFKQNNLLIFNPEIGLSFMGAISIFYGYNLPIYGMNYFGRHKISLTLAIPIKKKRWPFYWY